LQITQTCCGYENWTVNFSSFNNVMNIKTYSSVEVYSLLPIKIVFINFRFTLLVYKRPINENGWNMYYDILFFTKMFRSLMQRSSGYHTRIRTIIYFKCADIESSKTVFFLFHWKLQAAEMLQLELTNVLL